MQLMKPFDATQWNPAQGSPQFPVGKHPVIINGDEVRPTRDNSGGMLVLNLQITDGPSKGQEGEYRLNLYNQSEKACEIAHRQLSAISHVTGVFKFDDARALHNIPFIIEVGLQKGKEEAEKGYTEIKRVFDINGNEPGKGAGGPASGAASGGAGNGGGNWGGGQQQPPQQQPNNAGGGWNNAPGGAGPGNNQPNNGASWNQNGGNNAPAGGQQNKPAWGRS